MAIPVWVPGQILTSSDVNTWMVPNAINKPADQTVTSSTTLQNDSALVLPVAANASYIFVCFINYEGGTQGSSDFKWQWANPAGSGMRYGVTYIGTGGGVTVTAQSGADIITAGTTGGGNRRSVVMNGSIVTGSTSGNMQFTWAQGTSSGTGTIVHAQSTLTLQRTG